MIFKKAFSLFLITVMLVSNSGLAFTVHFCGGAISSFKALSDADEGCGGGTEIEKSCCAKVSDHSGCCDNKTIKIKDIPDEVLLKSFQKEFKTFAIAPPQENYQKNYLTITEFFPIANYSYQEHSPPLFKLYSSLLLYA